ncbi:MAG TPA: hypothetical protein VGC06_13535 [Actinomycetes bacterium]
MSDSRQPNQPPEYWQVPPQPPPASQPYPPSGELPTAPIDAGPPPGEVPVYDRPQPGGARRQLVLAAVIALLVGLGGGYAIGRQTAPKGAGSLAEAVQLASAGKLPTGDLSSLRGGLRGALGRRAGNGQGGNGQGGNGNGTANGNAQGNGGGFLFGGGQGGRGIQATVQSVSGDTVTLQTPAGQLRVRIGPDTKIRKATGGARSDIIPGGRVLVTFDLGGSGGGDGTVAAASILFEGRSQ